MRDDIAFCCHPRGSGDPVRLAARPLDPGSALRAVRDDVMKKGRAVRDDVMKKGRAVREDVKSKERAVRDDARRVVCYREDVKGARWL